MTASSREVPGVGRGVHALIPSGPTGPRPTAGQQASVALAALRTVPVRAAVVQAAVALLTDLAETALVQGDRDAAAATVTLLLEALDTAP
ncbi:hypothetical protein [Streptomyces sp. NBC_01465]|uniref:hypothetical protein n=1 Tax=Streptomyces sp. NBC_01465 TaxID=2903878 RepID=UPI002E3677B1|nr:hypothetical protein [Streptomyces sp. NBC_01465]